MTLCIGWIRSYNRGFEICLATDSLFTGGQTFCAAPKLFPLKRGDCALACAGETQYSFPVMEHIVRSIELNPKGYDRACDITDLKHYIVDVTNKCLFEERDRQDGSNGPGFRFIIAGYSWKYQKPMFWIVSYQKHDKKMVADGVNTIKGKPVAVIGDCVSSVRHKIFERLENDGVPKNGDFDMQPLEVLLDYINDKTDETRTIGGYLQMLKIYPFCKIMPVGFRYNKNDDYFITYYGRPLLKYETFPFPIYDVTSKKMMYMREISSEFVLEHEDTKKLSKFVEE